MSYQFNCFWIVLLSVAVSSVQAAQTRFTVPMAYSVIRNVLVHQLYTRPGETVRFWKDGKDCSFLDAANPTINGENGLVRIENQIHAQMGIQVAGKCMPVVTWRGVVQTWQKPTLDQSGTVLSFPVTRVNAFDQQGQLHSKQIEDLLTNVVQPQLGALKLDLNERRKDIVKTLLPFVDGNDSELLHDTLSSLRFNQVEAGEQSLRLDMSFMDTRAKKTAANTVAPFSEEELQQWRGIWAKLEQNLESGLNKLPLDQQNEEDKATLREVLQAADAAFSKGLTAADIDDHDPVRAYLNTSWDKLGPLLRNASKQLPGLEGLQYLTLIAATDIMYELENVTAPLGIEISANGLRKMVRAYLLHQTQQQGAASTQNRVADKLAE